MSTIYSDAIKVKRGLLHIARKSNKYVYLDNGNHYHGRSFYQVLNAVRILDNASLTEPVPKIIAKSAVKFSTGNYVPLRYIVLQNWQTMLHEWAFALEHTSHSELEEAFQKLHGEEWIAHSGGFYKLSDDNQTLIMYGKSGKFGFNPEFETEAKYALLAKRQRVVFNNGG